MTQSYRRPTLVTGGAGFIGSHVVRMLLSDADARVVNVDKLTYAGNLASLRSVDRHPGHILERVDICDEDEMTRIIRTHRPRSILHLAAESHVDRSIDGPADFIQTNIVGTYTLLEVAKKYFNTLSREEQEEFRFVHVSTDEVFGSLGDEGFFTEDSSYQPNSPYSASKASADHLVRAWHHTYGLPLVVTNCSNNYGPNQFPEKLIPLTILNAHSGREIPVYGDGKNVRDWLYVEDHARALVAVLDDGVPGETYCIGGKEERSNLEVVHAICSILDEIDDRALGHDRSDLISFVTDRPGHDQRYAIDPSKIHAELGWEPSHNFAAGLRRTVDWYLANSGWCSEVVGGRYAGERLGLIQPIG